MPKFRPLPPTASAQTSRITPEKEKNHFDRPMKSRLQRRFCSPAPSAVGSEMSLERPIEAERRLGQQHGREERDERADAQREREALDPRRGEDEEDERDHEGHDVRVDDRRQAALVARRDARRDRAPGADLLLDAFEDDDVRVGRDADREDQARDARQRQRDRDELDQREEEDRVDGQRADRDEAQHAVEDEQEEGDDGEARDAGDEALVERLLAERGRDLRGRDQLEPDRQRAGLEEVGQPLGGLDREAAGDLRARAAVDAVGVLAGS